jgi:tRNA A58 N-methylase Trm61
MVVWTAGALYRPAISWLAAKPLEAAVNIVTVEINRGDGRGWQSDHVDDTRRSVTIDMIALDIRRYADATGHAHRALLNGVMVAAYDPNARRAIGQRRGA